MSLLSGWFGGTNMEELELHDEGYELNGKDCYDKSSNDNFSCQVKDQLGDATPCHVNGVDACPRHDIIEQSNEIYKEIQANNPDKSYIQHLKTYKEEVGDNWELEEETIEDVKAGSWWTF